MLKEEKSKIRKLIKDYFKSPDGINIIKKTEKLQNSNDYCRAFLNKIPQYQKAKTIFAYYPIAGEFPTIGLLRQAAADKKTISLPLVSEKELIFKKMEFKAGEIEPVEIGTFGIMEPSQRAMTIFPQEKENNFQIECPILILVPGRAFSKNGERLGRGGGFYDRFFAKFFKTIKREYVCLAGICFSEQIFENIPMGKFDYPVDIVISESDIFIK